MPSLATPRPAEDPTTTYPEPRPAETALPGGGRVGLAVVGPDGRWVEFDPGLCAVLGRETAELGRCLVDAVLHPADTGAERARHAQLLAGTLRGYRAELRLVRGDGAVVWALVDGRAAAGPEGRLAGVGLVVQDVTARRDLEASGNGWAASAAELDDPRGLVALKDPDGGYTRVNARFEERFRVSDEVLRGHDDSYLFPPGAASALRGNDALAAEAPGLVEGRDVIPLADGEHALVAFRFALLDPTGTSRGTCAVWAEPEDRDVAAALAERLINLDRASRDDAARQLAELARAEAAVHRAALARLPGFLAESASALRLADPLDEPPESADERELVEARARAERAERELGEARARLEREPTERERTAPPAPAPPPAAGPGEAPPPVASTAALVWALERELVGVPTLEHGVGRALIVLCRQLGCDVGACYLPQREVLRCCAFWQAPDVDAGGLETLCWQTHFAPGRDLVGRVAADPRPVLVADLTAPGDSPFRRWGAAAAAGLRSGLAFPIPTRHGLPGVVELFSRSGRPLDARALAAVAAAARAIGDFVARTPGEATDVLRWLER